MTQERSLAIPDSQTFRNDMQAITEFQKVVHAHMVLDHDYGVIPGTKKPTLLKPGAEKIAKLLGLADLYEIIDRQENWDKGFFRYIIKCSLKSASTGVVVSEGLGECNSMEGKYRWRWVSENQLPVGITREGLVSEERKSSSGGHWTVYRLDNEDIYSQVNTILKMAKKRALVDAALSAGRLSDLFTQDLEDIPAFQQSKPTVTDTPTPSNEHYCVLHREPFFKKGKMKAYAHPVKDKEGNNIYDENGKPLWCYEHREATSELPAEPTKGEYSSKPPKESPYITVEQWSDLKSSMESLGMNDEKIKEWLADTIKKGYGKDITKPGEILKEWVQELQEELAGYQEEETPF